MSPNFDEILLELGYKFGIVDLSKENQVNELVEILKSYGVDSPNEVAQKARVYFSYLNEDDIVKNKKTGNIYIVQKMDPTKHVRPTPKEIQKAKVAGGGQLPKGEPSISKKPSIKGKTTIAPKADIGLSGAEKAKVDKTSSDLTKSGKNKTLSKIDSLKSKNFLLKTEPDDSTFDKKNKGSQIGPPPKPFKFPKEIYQNAKIPKRHLQELERMMRTKLDDKSKKWSHFSDLPGGAGKIPAQAGELMTLIGTTLDDKTAATFYNSLANYEKQQIESHPDLAKSSKRIVTKEWIGAAINNRKAIRSRLSKEYPGAKIEAGSWDTEGEVESLGLQDYKKNKGFSTDVYFKIKTKQGKSILDEVSLKKDKNVNLLNSGTGEFLKWDPNISDEINPKVYAQNERKALMAFAKKNLQKLVSISKKDKDLQSLIKDKGIDIKQAYQLMISGKGSNRDTNSIIYGGIKALKNAKNADASKYVDAVDKTHKKYIQNGINALSNNKKLKQGMLNSIKEEFPLKAVGEGEESMAIGDMSLDRAVLTNIFGTSNFDQIKEGLVAVTDATPPYIAYRAKSSKVTIPIAQISIREDGVGYGGQLKFEMKLDDRFAKILKSANQKIYG